MLRCCCVSLPGNVKKRLVDLALPLFQESEDEKLLVEQPGNMSRDVQAISGFCWIAVIVVCLHIDIHRSRFEHILSVSLYVGVVIVADRTMLWHVAATWLRWSVQNNSCKLVSAALVHHSQKQLVQSTFGRAVPCHRKYSRRSIQSQTISGIYPAINWFEGKPSGNHVFSHEKWGVVL